MNTAPKVIGNHAFYFRDGDAFTVPSAGTAGRNDKPGAADTGWVDLGIINDLEFEHQREERDIFAPSPGQLRLYDVLETKRLLSARFTAQEMSPLVFELLFGTLKLTSASTQYNPLEGTVKKGWVKLQQYDEADQAFNTVDIYAHLKIGGAVAFNDQVVTAQLEARVLHSTLNTGTL
jgi:hypothetical protein